MTAFSNFQATGIERRVGGNPQTEVYHRSAQSGTRPKVPRGNNFKILAPVVMKDLTPTREILDDAKEMINETSETKFA